MQLNLNSDKAAFFILQNKKEVMLQLDSNNLTVEIDYHSLSKGFQQAIDRAVLEGTLSQGEQE